MLRSGFQEVDALDLLALYRKGLITPYYKNRGGESKDIDTLKVSLKTRANVCQELVPDALGLITICKMVNTKNQPMIIVDGHSRLSGLLQRLEDKDIPVDDFNFNLLVNLVEAPTPSYMKLIYEKLNTQTAHSSINKLTHNDYEMGKLSEELLHKAGVTRGEYAFEFENARPVFCSIIARIFEKALEEDFSRYTYTDCYAARGRVNKVYNRICGQKNPNKVKLNDDQKENIIQALEYYLAVKAEFIRNIPLYEDGTFDDHDFYKIFRTVACFGIIVSDRLNSPSQRHITNVKPETLGKKLFDNAKVLHSKFGMCNNGSQDAKNETFQSIISQLTRKVSRKKLTSQTL